MDTNKVHLSGFNWQIFTKWPIRGLETHTPRRLIIKGQAGDPSNHGSTNMKYGVSLTNWVAAIKYG